MLGLLFLVSYVTGCAIFLELVFKQEPEKL